MPPRREPPPLHVIVDDVVAALAPHLGPTVEDWERAAADLAAKAPSARTALQRVLGASIADRVRREAGHMRRQGSSL